MGAFSTSKLSYPLQKTENLANSEKIRFLQGFLVWGLFIFGLFPRTRPWRLRYPCYSGADTSERR